MIILLIILGVLILFILFLLFIACLGSSDMARREEQWEIERKLRNRK